MLGIVAGAGSDLGNQLFDNGFDWGDIDWGSVANRGLVGGALGFSLSMGVGYLGPLIAGSATAGGLTTGGAFVGAKTMLLGTTMLQWFALGALAVNTTAFLVAPLYGIEMQGIEYEAPSSPYSQANNVGPVYPFK